MKATAWSIFLATGSLGEIWMRMASLTSEYAIFLICSLMVAEKKREGKRRGYTDKLVQHGRDFILPHLGPDRDDPEPGDLPLLLGDVVVCPAVAQRQAPSHAGSYDDELAVLVVHGVLHVLGHDHAEPGETAVMQARERELLDRFHHRR